MSVPVRQTHLLAVVSLVSGILGWTLVPVLGAVVAVITGHVARGEIRRQPERYDGDGLALAGLVLGWLMIGLAIAGLLLVFVLLGGVAALAL